MKNITKTIITLTGLALAGLLVVVLLRPSEDGDQAAPSLTEISVRLPIPIIEAGQTPFYVAQDKGYYADEGLSVQFEMGSPELNPVRMVVAGQDDFGVLGGPDTLLVARSQGQPLTAVAVLHRNSNFPVLISLDERNIMSPEQLEDSRIGFFYGHISTDVLRNFLRRQGVTYEEFDVGFDYNRLLSGLIDAEWGFRVTAGLDLPANGVAIRMMNPADYGINSHGYTLFATDETIQERPEVVLRFLRATLRGVADTVADPEGANEALLRRASTLDPELSLRRLRLYNEVTSSSDAFPPGYMDRAMFDDTYNRLVDEDVIETPIDVDSTFTTEFLDELRSERRQLVSNHHG